LDIQKDALDKTSLLLEESLNSNKVRIIKEWRFQLWFGEEFCGLFYSEKHFSQNLHFFVFYFLF
jgi:hypothetical protein